jgi:Uma2 family endonuclease
MANATLVPVELYLGRTDEYEPDAEYVDGVIEERAVGQYDHATWQHAIELWFELHRQEWNIRVRCELRVQTSATHYRVPDVVVWDRTRPIEQILTHPPIAVFEVLSPEDRIARLMLKLQDYARMGIQTIRIIHPETKTISRYEQGALIPIESNVESLPGSSCFLDWTKIESLLDD